METNEVFKKSIEIENEKIELKERLKRINRDYLELVSDCSHEIAFKFHDNRPRMMIIDGNYYCPACGKIEEYIFKNQYLSGSFKNSKIIDLKNIYLIKDEETLKKIREEVINNRDFYYNSKDINELRIQMEDALRPYQQVYKKTKNKSIQNVLHKY